ncbi:hypothetical protein HAX54_011995 [Datura stramonium]|uniref:Uncharacterized protein n=1 Tax=Datura stramonium TaxID=4076 RepID=A0ABS8TLV1_DATST|nr:hypothetical protein [Datura stramonium]
MDSSRVESSDELIVSAMFDVIVLPRLTGAYSLDHFSYPANCNIPKSNPNRPDLVRCFREEAAAGWWCGDILAGRFLVVYLWWF